MLWNLNPLTCFQTIFLCLQSWSNLKFIELMNEWLIQQERFQFTISYFDQIFSPDIKLVGPYTTTHGMWCTFFIRNILHNLNFMQPAYPRVHIQVWLSDWQCLKSYSNTGIQLTMISWFWLDLYFYQLNQHHRADNT